MEALTRLEESAAQLDPRKSGTGWAAVDLFALVASLSSTELFHAAEAKWQMERRLSEERIARLSATFWGPALGAYRTNHQPPPFPPDAPELPVPRRKVRR